MTSPRHSWDSDNERHIAASDCASGCGETIRTCKSCGLIMITVHPPTGLPWHEFTQPGASARIKLDHRPPCREADVVGIAAAPAEVPFS
jgi:hypothetical protein